MPRKPGITHLASVKPWYQTRNSRTAFGLRQSAMNFDLSVIGHWLQKRCGRRPDATMTAATTCQYLSRVQSRKNRHGGWCRLTHILGPSKPNTTLLWTWDVTQTAPRILRSSYNSNAWRLLDARGQDDHTFLCHGIVDPTPPDFLKLSHAGTHAWLHPEHSPGMRRLQYR
ncbi:hypothetical protein EK21DRAFT_83790 [Setomelanomma holmii]|uniref:Uncharacterized protein n=1 Tax=Setomelanomma holmii TaxID=210430 RepID=A0A9P4HIV4_9PLEO|nr:hypothetical protein EK21DRAFT_83790 [Setomelanomma holmii]